jgi:DNA-nicking Smr family endonuclease
VKHHNRDDEPPDDSALFDQAVGDVKRLHHKQAAPVKTRTTPIPSNPAAEETTIEFGEELRYLRPGIQALSLQRLRRGQFPIDNTLDLHGLTAAEASIRVQQFLQQSQMNGCTAVRIVHGKGYGSAGGQPVLKARVQQLLVANPSVLAFCSARPQDGGTGAVDVLLRKSKVSR